MLSAVRQTEHLLFSALLERPDGCALRDQLLHALSHHSGNLQVTTFFELVDTLRADTRSLRHRRRGHFIILDLQRIVVFNDGGDADDPDIASLTYFLMDGYPLQPFKKIAAEERDRNFRFCFDPIVFDLLPACLVALKTGEYCVLDLVSGELSQGTLLGHPAVHPIQCHGMSMPGTPLTVESVCTDRSMRSKPPPPLDDLIESAAGVIRSDSVRSGAASVSIATADLMWDRGVVKEACHGKAASPIAARQVARCEALERFQIAYAAPGTELVRGSYADLKQYAVNPADLFFWNAQSADARFDPLQPLSWTWAWGPAAREWRLVPAQDVWFNIPTLMREPRVVFPSTSGCAAGATLAEAAVFAAFEAIERDAFLTSWYLQRPARQIDPRSFKSEEMQLLLGRFRLALPNYRAVLFDLTSDVGIPTIGGLAIRRRGRNGPRVYASVATHIDAEKACHGALKDLTTFSADLTVEQLAEIRRRVNEPDGLDHPGGHMDLYALDESVHAFDYLQLGRRYVKVDDVGTQSPIPPHDELRLDAVVTMIDTRLRELGAALYLKELTHPAFAARGLRAVRAITPGLYPLWFGRRARRFAVTARLEALALRYCGRPFRSEQLQLATHPLG